MNFIGRNNKRPNTRTRAAYMTDQMNTVVQSYISRYNQKGYFQVDNSSIIKNISVVVIPLMQNILTKYNENDFHRKMNHVYTDEYGYRAYGFDFIGDWRSNHPFAFNIAMQIVRNYKKGLKKFDIDIATGLVIDIMRSWGWHPTINEAKGIRHLLWRMKRIIINA